MDTSGACGGCCCWDMERAWGLETGLASEVDEKCPRGVSLPLALARGVVRPLRLGKRRGEWSEERKEEGDRVLRPMLPPLGVKGGRPAVEDEDDDEDERSQTDTVRACMYVGETVARESVQTVVVLLPN